MEYEGSSMATQYGRHNRMPSGDDQDTVHGSYAPNAPTQTMYGSYSRESVQADTRSLPFSRNAVHQSSRHGLYGPDGMQPDQRLQLYGRETIHQGTRPISYDRESATQEPGAVSYSRKVTQPDLSHGLYDRETSQQETSSTPFPLPNRSGNDRGSLTASVQLEKDGPLAVQGSIQEIYQPVFEQSNSFNPSTAYSTAIDQRNHSSSEEEEKLEPADATEIYGETNENEDNDDIAVNNETYEEYSVSYSEHSSDAVHPWQGRWCYVCQKSVKPRCKLHRYHHLKDKPVVCRAEVTLPSSLRLDKSDPLNLAVVARRPLFASTLFGPLQGRHIPLTQMETLDYHWLISHDNDEPECLVADDEEESNWLIYLRKTTNMACVNTESFQYGCGIFFVTTRPIKTGEELFHYYSVGYHEQMSLVLDENIIGQYPPPGHLKKSVVKRSRKNKPIKMKIRKMEPDEDGEDDGHEVVMDIGEDSALYSPSEHDSCNEELERNSVPIVMQTVGRKNKRPKKKKMNTTDFTGVKPTFEHVQSSDHEKKKKKRRQSYDSLQLVSPTFVDCEPDQVYPEIRLSKHVKEATAEFRNGRKYLSLTLVTETPLNPPRMDAIKYPTLSIDELTQMGMLHDQVAVNRKAKSRPAKKRTQSDAQINYYPDTNNWLGQQNEGQVQSNYPMFSNDRFSTISWAGGTTTNGASMVPMAHSRLVYPNMAATHPLDMHGRHPLSRDTLNPPDSNPPVAFDLSNPSSRQHMSMNPHPLYQRSISESIPAPHMPLQSTVDYHKEESHLKPTTEAEEEGLKTASVEHQAVEKTESSGAKDNANSEKNVSSTLERILAMTKKHVPGFSIYPETTDVEGTTVVYTYSCIPEEWNTVFICIDCGRLLKTRKFMGEHITKHSTDAKYLCDNCGKGFKTASMLARHKYSVHTTFEQKNTRGTICSFCSKWFADRYKLKRHELTHTGEQYKHICSICSKKFSATYHLKRHLLTVHHGYRPHLCPICGKGFSERKDQKHHVVKVHGVDTAAAGLGLGDVQKITVEKEPSLPVPASLKFNLDSTASHVEREAPPVSVSSHLQHLPQEQYAAVNSLLSFY